MEEKITLNHDEVRRWAEKYGGRPQLINDPKAQADLVGIRISFPGSQDDRYLPKGEVRTISWDEFFKYFDRLGLAFSYTDPPANTDSGTLSDSYFFIKRNAVDDRSNRELERTISGREEAVNDFQNVRRSNCV